VWVDVLTPKVRKGGRIINVHALIAVDVNSDEYPKTLGIDVATAEDGADWLAFQHDLRNPPPSPKPDSSRPRPAPDTAPRQTSSPQHATKTTHRQVDSLQLHYARNRLTRVPKSAQPWVATLLRTVFE
jgi:transposase-like protein